MISVYVHFFIVFVAKSFLEEIVKIHDCLMQLSLTITHGQCMLPLLEAVTLFELI